MQFVRGGFAELVQEAHGKNAYKRTPVFVLATNGEALSSILEYYDARTRNPLLFRINAMSFPENADHIANL